MCTLFVRRGRRLRASAGAAVVAVAVMLIGGATAAPAAARADDNGRFQPGAAGVGDAYFPEYGNGGYDVSHYDLSLRYDPATDFLGGVATIDAIATDDLDRFNLDLVGLKVESIAVDGKRAAWTRTPHELVISPQHKLKRGASFEAVVAYSGIPTPVVILPWNIPSGFMHTDDGMLTAGQPDGPATWFPVNDHPVDRATYTFRVTVPTEFEVVANGLPIASSSLGGWTTSVWEARDPMISYLATVNVGQWDVRTYETASGLPVIDAVDPDLGDVADAALARQPEVVEFLSEAFGPYPFETVGAIVDDSTELWFALETQTRPNYSRYFFEWPDGTRVDGTPGIVHELAHQWYGDSVAVGRWQDIWLNEGLATYAEFLWTEHEGGPTANETARFWYDLIPADDTVDDPPFWTVKIGDPGPVQLFHFAVYFRGAMTVQALRNAVGDAAFWDIVRTWARTKALGNGTTPEFIELAELVSGEQLDDLFQTWLFTSEKPPLSALTQDAAVAAPSAAAPVVPDRGNFRPHILRR